MVNVHFECLKCHKDVNGSNGHLWDVLSYNAFGKVKITASAICNGCGRFVQRAFVVEEQYFDTLRKRIADIFYIREVKHPADVF